MIWTIVPWELVWEGIEAKVQEPVQMKWQGVDLLVEPIGFARGKIVQLLSTEPNDYLKPELQPGTIIELKS
ncbi:MAG: hypothetical protein GX322_11795 [Firmicutes bacterium]|nr:hypothetical protein [Bacillota bacterium]